MDILRFRGRLLALILVSSLAGFAPPSLLAHHGPGTTGGAVSTQSGETMKPDTFSLGLTWSYTQFEHLTDSQIAERTAKVKSEDPDFDAIRWSLLQMADLSYGVAEDFQIGISFGLYRGDSVREGHLDDSGNPVVEDSGDVTGWTDVWVNGKYRILKGPSGHWAVYGGIKLPLGRDDVRNDAGERLEASLQPGSGAFDFLFGTAYTYYFTPQLTADASVQYIYRTEHDDFKIGDRAEGGVAVAYRFIEDLEKFPQVSAFLETNVVYLFKNHEADHDIDNSGGTYLFMAPGVKVGFSKKAALTFAPQFPVVQALNDQQQETLFKLNIGLTFSF